MSQLSVDKQWLALLHMRKHGNGYLSEVDDPDFFLSKSPSDPLAELRETIGYFQRDDQAWCRFPARGMWLQKMGVQNKPFIDCEGLRQWRSAFPVGKLVLVFPSVYLNSASSMFGHTFLRFENTTGDGVSQLGKAVSYYADMNEEGASFDYIYKGLTGGFSGVIDVSPFYEMSRKYIENEDRDIWEYNLVYSEPQIRFLIDHLWEIRGHHFDYYFFDENCSYRIIDILDVVTPTYDMRENFHVYALPVETIRLLDQKGLINGKMYKPSSTKLLKRSIAKLDNVGQSEVKALLEQQRAGIKSASSDDMAVALQYLQADIHKNGVFDDKDLEVADLSAALLARAGMDDDQRDSSTPTPDHITAISPDVGHLNRRLRVMSGQLDGRSFNDYEWRETFHDYVDPLPGYENGMKLSGPGVTMRQFSDRWELEKINFIDVGSLNAVDGWFNPLSWNAGVMRQREWIDGSHVLVNSADIKTGFTTSVLGWRYFLLGGGGLAYSSHINSGLTLKDVATIGALYQDNDWSLMANVTWHDYPSAGVPAVRTADFALGRPVGRNLSLQFRFQEDSAGGEKYRALSTGIAWYY
ncbi:MAG TPA: DUF4105 domain-containing protein [Pseudomonadales bacterium]|nr:DUF4105 domain-containing protein [Pseudomonadales bacterium]